MRSIRSRILSVMLAFLVAFHWLPGAFAAATPVKSVICGEQDAAGFVASWIPGDDAHGCKHDCKLCSGTGVSAPAIVPIVAPGALVAHIGGDLRSPDLTSAVWAPAWARPPPRG